MKDDREGIKRLLKQIFLKDSINIEALTDFLIGQTGTGFILRQYSDDPDPEEDEDYEEDEILGLVSYVNLSDNSEKDFVKQLSEYMLKYLQKSARADMERLITSESKKVWIINERFVNLPWKLALPSFEQMCKEISESNVNYDHYFLICKIMHPKTRFGPRNKQSRSEVLFLNPEEEVFDEFSKYSFEFNVSSQTDSDPRGGSWDEDDMQYAPHRRVLVFDQTGWTKAIEKLKEVSKSN